MSGAEVAFQHKNAIFLSYNLLAMVFHTKMLQVEDLEVKVITKIKDRVQVQGLMTSRTRTEFTIVNENRRSHCNEETGPHEVHERTKFVRAKR